MLLSIKDYNNKQHLELVEFQKNSRSIFTILDVMALEEKHLSSFYPSNYLTSFKLVLLTIRKLVFLNEGKVFSVIKENK